MNIGQCLTKSARTFPNNLAIAYGTRKLSYAEFNSRANRLANALYKHGIQQGDNVAVLMHNCPEMLESMYAGFKAGCGVVPLNFRLHPKEYTSIIKHSEAKVVIISPEFNKEIIKACALFPCVQSIITLSGGRDNMLNYESLLSAESDQFDDADVDAEDVAWIFYTSGTTGIPKGAMLTHRNLLSMTMNFYADMAPGFGSSDIALHAAPLSHGSGCYALPNIAKGAANVILESKSFDPETVLRTIQTYRVTNMFAAPTMIKRLIDSAAIDRYDHSSLKYLNYGGAPMLVEDLIDAMRKLGRCLVQLYGQAESPMTITYLSHDDHVLDGDSYQMKRLASAGIPRTDVEVKVVDPDGNELPPGETGEIVTRSDLVMKGYWRAPETTAETLRDGWLYTGDMGYMDERGYLFLMDRSKDMIISGGENIYPREIEEVIVGHPAVREVAVIGIPDPVWGEAIKAIVSLVPGGTVAESELIDFCTEHIARYKKPRSVDFVDELPKNNYGKIVKRELREKYWEGKTSRVI